MKTTKILLALPLLLALAWSPVAPAPVFRAVQLDMAEACDEFASKYSYGVCSEYPIDHAHMLDLPVPKYGILADCRRADLDLTAELITGA